MLTEILYLNLIIAGILILSGFYFKKKALFLSLSGSIILIITGIVFYSEGVSIINGATETVVNNVTTILKNRTTIQDNTTYISSFVILVLGFAGVIGSAIGFYDDKNKKAITENDKGYDEDDY